MELTQEIVGKVRSWREVGYPHSDFPAVAEILDWLSGRDAGQPPFLRIPQVRALETYWYLRLVEGTPGIFDLYQSLIQSKVELRKTLGLNSEILREYAEEHGFDALIEHIRNDDAFVKQHKLESLRETLTLDYPSYILALAMGAGKTMLIGAIIATEFAMAQEYPDENFVHNALVFAPGKTIIESLRELATMPFDGILPPRMHKPFAASVKLTFTRDGSPDIDVIPGSHYNIVVTNTEKIRIQKASIRKGDLGSLFAGAGDADALKQDVANRRLQRLAQLPHLGVFSDEAHHTYGQSMDTELKKVRKTVDYLASETNVVCVVNTTGTPYYNKQPLLDVVYWYGLSQGIEDGYLKPVSGNIEAYDFGDDIKPYVTEVVGDFLKRYGDVSLPNGAKAKLAIYFPQTDDLEAMRPVVEAALAANGHAPSECLANHSHSPQADVDAFNRLNDPASTHRAILLVNRGTEGWNCPSLFACALARNLQSSNNFVLQAATRCLRQVPGNSHKAKIYLSQDNYAVLDRQLQETYGESLADLKQERENLHHAKIVLLKENIPPLVLKRQVVRVRRVEAKIPEILELQRPDDNDPALTVQRYELAAQASSTKVMRELGDALPVEAAIEVADTRTVAADLGARYRLPLFAVLDALCGAYGDDDVPLRHLDALASQLEDQVRHYETESEEIEVALALVRPEGFNEEQDADGKPIRTAEITYRKDREKLLWNVKDARADYGGGFGFHYSPYNFDSLPEKDFLAKVLATLQLDAADIEDVYFTGALGRDKTDFVVEYKGVDGRWHPYSPDFLIRQKPKDGGIPGSGRLLIVEIKQERLRKDETDGESGRKAMAVHEWARLNPDRIDYEILFTDTDTVANNDFARVRTFLGGKS
ncbi:restriction endonuclease subunit R [Lysobacter oculi]|uniref:Restriction endonuclease subunit R n=1 Tax=Solilutibacter oculi TaxID=2698682 RepID=A0A344J4Z1_9GAMM|nr:restriction endonuclease subunit R [Lysobacter oculi]